MKEYKIKLENGKYNIYYYVNGEEETKEFYGLDKNNPVTQIRFGYVEKVD